MKKRSNVIDFLFELTGLGRSDVGRAAEDQAPGMSYLASVAATMMLYVFSAIILWNRAEKGRVWMLAALALVQGVWILPLARLASAYGRKGIRDGMETAYMFMAVWGFMVCGIWFFYWLTSRALTHLGG